MRHVPLTLVRCLDNNTLRALSEHASGAFQPYGESTPPPEPTPDRSEAVRAHQLRVALRTVANVIVAGLFILGAYWLL